MLLIHVVDADDLPAKFTAYAYSTAIREDALLGSSVYQVKAYDLDKGINGTVTYSIVQDTNPSQLFSIDNNTGVISLNGSIDRETREEYIIRVMAHSSFPFSDHATVTIKLLDVNDNKPVFSQSRYSATVFENLDPGTVVLQVVAMDNDKGINGKLRYSIQNITDSNRFHIDYQTGKISTTVILDRQDKDSFVLIVAVQDMDGNNALGTMYNDTSTVYIKCQEN